MLRRVERAATPERVAAGGLGGEGFGGGLFLAGGTVNVQDTTIADNQASTDKGGAGGPGNLGGPGGAGTPNGPTGSSSSTGPNGQSVTADGGGIDTWIAALLANTIVAANTAGTQDIDVSGDLAPTSFNNLIGTPGNLINPDGTGGLTNAVNGNIVGVADPALAPLGDYGGPTQTMALLAGSPAINNGVKISGVTVDQRGFAASLFFARSRTSAPSRPGRTSSSPMPPTPRASSCRWATSASGRPSTWPTSWAGPRPSSSTRRRSRSIRRLL